MEVVMRQHTASASPYEEQAGFSRGVRADGRIFVAGTAPIGDDGHTVDGDAYAQARRCFTIAVRAVEELGGNVGDVVRTRMFIVDKADWPRISEAHADFFAGARPAATCVVVAGLLDDDWRVEVEVDAVVGASLEGEITV